MRWCTTCQVFHGLMAACPVRVEAEAAGDDAVELTEQGRLYAQDYPSVSPCDHVNRLCSHGVVDEEV